MKSFRNKLHRARQLSFSDWWDVSEAWGLLLYCHLVSRWTSYEKLNLTVGSIAEGRSDSVQEFKEAERKQQLIEIASRLHLISMTCLMKSLTLQKMLAREHIPAKVCIGIETDIKAVHAHAWVEVGGRAVGEVEDVSERFRVLSW